MTAKAKVSVNVLEIECEFTPSFSLACPMCGAMVAARGRHKCAKRIDMSRRQRAPKAKATLGQERTRGVA